MYPKPQFIQNNDPVPMQIDSIQEYRKTNQNNNTNINNRSKPTCFKCGKTGHYASKCLKAKGQ